MQFLIKEMMLQEIVPGDLIVAIEELEHEFLKLHYDLYISFEAVLGISKDIEAINGKVRIKLEEFNLSRLKGKRNSKYKRKWRFVSTCKCMDSKP
jgi:DnaJ-class molecular chaperone